MSNQWEIYVVTCLTTGLKYVGQTRRDYRWRFGQHLYEAFSLNKDWPLAVAIREHGKDAFEVIRYAICTTREEANESERTLIAQLRCIHPNGYNLTFGGGGTLGIKRSREWREAHSKRLKAIAKDSRWGTNSSAAQKQVWAKYSPTERAQRIEAGAATRRGRVLGPRTRTIRDPRQDKLI